jgi:hypothetical protein
MEDYIFCGVNNMEELNLFAIVLIIFGILQIILFFKLWIMTNDVRKLKEYFCGKTEYPNPTRTLSEQDRNNAAKQALAHLR